VTTIQNLHNEVNSACVTEQVRYLTFQSKGVLTWNEVSLITPK